MEPTLHFKLLRFMRQRKKEAAHSLTVASVASRLRCASITIQLSRSVRFVVQLNGRSFTCSRFSPALFFCQDPPRPSVYLCTALMVHELMNARFANDKK